MRFTALTTSIVGTDALQYFPGNGCTEEEVRVMSAKDAYNVLTSDAVRDVTQAPSLIVADFIDNKNITQSQVSLDCQQAYVKFVDDFISSEFVVGACKTDNKTTRSVSCVENTDVYGALRNFIDQAGYSVDYPQCSVNTVSATERLRYGYVAIVQGVFNDDPVTDIYTQFNLTGDSDTLCGSCYAGLQDDLEYYYENDFAGSSSSEAALIAACLEDPLSDECIASPDMEVMRRNFGRCSGFTLPRTGKDCTDKNRVDLAAASTPTYAYEQYTNAGLTPESSQTPAMTAYDDGVETTVGEPCHQCYEEYYASIEAIRDSTDDDDFAIVTECKGKVNTDACIDALKGPLDAFETCAGYNLVNKDIYTTTTTTTTPATTTNQAPTTSATTTATSYSSVIAGSVATAVALIGSLVL